LKLFWVVGFCGGFSTFSAFTDQTITMLLNQNYMHACINIGLSVLLCLASSLGGFLLSTTR
jgi:CrcB protein